MCPNYEPVTDNDRLLASFGVTLRDDDALAVPQGTPAMAPFIVRAEPMPADALGVAKWGLHGLLPPFAADLSFSKQSGICRSEGMKSTPTFRQSWWAGHRCIVPASIWLEWCYESGRPERWGIQRTDGEPMALAGLWNEWTSPAGQRLPSFTLLTLGALGHPVFGRMNAPAAEQRMPVILPESARQRWLYGSLQDAERLLLRYPADQLLAVAQEPATPSRREPRSWTATPDMFAFEWHMTAADLPTKRAAREPRALPARQPEAHGPTTRSLF
jgi:putative SOS response-associated peptidase YedK